MSILSSPHMHYQVASANTTQQFREIERLAREQRILRVSQPVGLDFDQMHGTGLAQVNFYMNQHHIRYGNIPTNISLIQAVSS